jgi:hypothetical protein
MGERGSELGERDLAPGHDNCRVLFTVSASVINDQAIVDSWALLYTGGNLPGARSLPQRLGYGGRAQSAAGDPRTHKPD